MTWHPTSACRVLILLTLGFVAACGDTIDAPPEGQSAPLARHVIAAVTGREVTFETIHARPGRSLVHVGHTFEGGRTVGFVTEIDVADATASPLHLSADGVVGEGGPPLRFIGHVAHLDDGSLVMNAYSELVRVAPRTTHTAPGRATLLQPDQTDSGDVFNTYFTGHSTSNRVSPDGSYVITMLDTSTDRTLDGVLGFIRLSDGQFLPAPDVPFAEFIRQMDWTSDTSVRLDQSDGWWDLAVDPDDPDRVRGTKIDPPPLPELSQIIGFADGRAVAIGPTDAMWGAVTLDVTAGGFGGRPFVKFVDGDRGHCLIDDRTESVKVGAGTLRVFDAEGVEIARLTLDDVAGIPDLVALARDDVAVRDTFVDAERHPMAAPGTLDFLVVHRTVGLLRLHAPEGTPVLEMVEVTMLEVTAEAESD